MIVIDTNILAYLLLEQPEASLKQRAKRLLKAEDRVLLPALWRHEFLNVLSMAVKAGRMSLPEAVDAWFRALAVAEAAEAPVDLPRALEASLRFGISTYDAQFVALAEQSNTILISEDKKLRRAVGALAVSMEEHLAA
jgi:predicted nucleic acid-binding protein